MSHNWTRSATTVYQNSVPANVPVCGKQAWAITDNICSSSLPSIMTSCFAVHKIFFGSKSVILRKKKRVLQNVGKTLYLAKIKNKTRKYANQHNN
jgi:hypothetical protein